MPFGGAAIALVFYEFVFVKSQDYLNEAEENSEGSDKGLSLQDGIDSSPPNKKRSASVDEEETNNE